MGSQPTSGRRLWPSYLDNAFMTYGRDTLAQGGRWEGGVRRRVFVRYAAAAIATWPVKARTQQAKVSSRHSFKYTRRPGRRMGNIARQIARSWICGKAEPHP